MVLSPVTAAAAQESSERFKHTAFLGEPWETRDRVWTLFAIQLIALMCPHHIAQGHSQIAAGQCPGRSWHEESFKSG